MEPVAAQGTSDQNTAGGHHRRVRTHSRGAAKASVRPVVNAGTLGTGAPVVSVIEDVASLGLSLLATLAPIIALLALLLFAYVALRLLRRARRRRARGEAHERV